MTTQPPPLLSIGLGIGGLSNENRQLYEEFKRIQRLVELERRGFTNVGLRMNLVFHIPGPLVAPDYTGIHATRFRRTTDEALVVSAVPPGLKAQNAAAYAAGSLREAALMAQTLAMERKSSASNGNLMQLVDHLAMLLDIAQNEAPQESLLN